MNFRWRTYRDWFEQARRTFLAISNDIEGKDYNWACFKAQQASEFALKGILYARGLPAFGNSVSQLGRKARGSIETLKLDEKCLAALDKLYIPTRYADAFPGGSPFTYYSEKDARDAEACARSILDAIERHVQDTEGDETC